MAGLRFPRETRAFAPHLTLGRVRDNVALEALGRLRAVLDQVPVTPVVWDVDEVALMRSTLTEHGAIYHATAVVALWVVGHFVQSDPLPHCDTTCHCLVDMV